MLLLSFVLPINPLLDLDPDAKERILQKAVTLVGLPAAVCQCIEVLLAGQPDAARRILQEWDVSASISPPRECSPEFRGELLSEEVLQAVVQRSAEFILSTTDLSRQDRLWPVDAKGFQNGVLNLAYGAAGTALFLNEALGGLPGDVEAWLLSRKVDQDTYPPGFYTGIAGVAYAFGELGHLERGAELLEDSYRSPLVFQEAGWYEGAAGWGWVNLDFYQRTGDARFLHRAEEAAEKILAAAEPRESGLCWRRRSTGKVHHGMAYGATGVAAFLVDLARLTGEERYRQATQAAVAFELASGEQSGELVDGTLFWGRWEGDRLSTPYWLHGESGIVTVLSRLYQLEGDPHFLTQAERLAGQAFTRFSALPSLFEGLAGIGEMLVDLYRLTGDETYKRKSYDLADSILRFAVERPEGLAMPGSFLLRLSTDLATGSAGVGLFFHRLNRPGRRLFHDLYAVPAVEQRAIA
jgi:hypothetical protein